MVLLRSLLCQPDCRPDVGKGLRRDGSRLGVAVLQYFIDGLRTLLDLRPAGVDWGEMCDDVANHHPFTIEAADTRTATARGDFFDLFWRAIDAV